MTIEAMTDKIVDGTGSVTDFTRAFLWNAIEHPWNGIAELAHLPQVRKPDYNPRSALALAGGVTGLVGDVLLLSKGIGGGLRLTDLSGLEGTVVGAGLKWGSAGALHGGLFTPGDHRLSTALVEGYCFSIAGGAARWLSYAPLLPLKTVSKPLDKAEELAQLISKWGPKEVNALMEENRESILAGLAKRRLSGRRPVPVVDGYLDGKPYQLKLDSQKGMQLKMLEQSDLELITRSGKKH